MKRKSKVVCWQFFDILEGKYLSKSQYSFPVFRIQQKQHVNEAITRKSEIHFSFHRFLLSVTLLHLQYEQGSTVAELAILNWYFGETLGSSLSPGVQHADFVADNLPSNNWNNIILPDFGSGSSGNTKAVPTQ